MIEIPALCKSYGKKQVVNAESICLESDCVYAVIGANGSGKSTWSKMICDIVKADKGDVSCLKAVKKGYLAQKSHAYRMSVKRNIMLNGRDEKRAEELMKKLELSSLSSRKAAGLSGGEMSKLFLARILMNEYDLLILDEPCAAMDMESTLIAEEVIRQYHERNQGTILLITHSMEEAARISDRVLFFHYGRICEEGETKRMIESPVHEETARFLSFMGAGKK